MFFFATPYDAFLYMHNGGSDVHAHMVVGTAWGDLLTRVALPGGQ